MPRRRSQLSGVGVEKIAAHCDLDAGVVDQAIDAAEALPGRRRQLRVAGKVRRTSPRRNSAWPPRDSMPDKVSPTASSSDDVVDDDVEAALGQGPADRPTDAATASGDEGGGTLAHIVFSIVSKGPH